MSRMDHIPELKEELCCCSVVRDAVLTLLCLHFIESRQHKRTSVNLLNVALALQELVRMGVDYIITFVAHDPRVSMRSC